MNEIEIDSLICKARAIVNITMENVALSKGEANDDTEYALWAASGLLSQAIELLEQPAPKRSKLGEDELAVQDEGRIVYFDDLLPEDRIDVRVSPEGVTLTTKGEAE